MSTTKQRGWLLGLCCLAVLALCSMGVAAAAVSANTPVGGEIIVPDGAFLAPRRYSVFSDSTGKFNRVVLTNSARTQFVPLQYMGGEGFEATELEFYQINLGSDMTTGMYFLSESVKFSVTSVNSADLTTTLGALSETDVAVTASSDGFLFTLADEDYLRHIVVLVELPWQDIPAGEGMPVCVFAENGVATSFQELGTSGNDRDEIVFPPLEGGSWIKAYGDVEEINGLHMGKGAVVYTATFSVSHTVSFVCHSEFTSQTISDGGHVTVPEISCSECARNGSTPFDYWSIDVESGQYSSDELAAYAVTQDITVAVNRVPMFVLRYLCSDGHEPSTLFTVGVLRDFPVFGLPSPCDNPIHEGKTVKYSVNGNPMDIRSLEEILQMTVIRNIFFQSVWTNPAYPVRFECHGVGLPTVDVEPGLSVTPPEANSCKSPSFHGEETFLGWYCVTLDQLFSSAELALYPVSKELLFYPSWQQLSTAVTFYDGESVLQTVRLALDTDLVFPAAPVKTGFVFQHWIDNFKNVVNSYRVRASDAPAVFSLRAVFIPLRLAITLDTAGGEAIPGMTVDYGAIPTLPTPVKNGHDFAGWYLTDGAQYVPAPVTDHFTLAAHWDLKLYNVIIHVDGKASFDLQIAFNTPLSDVLADPRLSDYNLSAVSAADGAEIDFKDGMAVAQDLRLELISKTAVQSLAVGLPLKIVGGVVGVGLLAGLLCLPAVFSKRRKKGVR